MSMSDALPTDSVLRRHAETERNRVLGLPPTDATLLRHHNQWQLAQSAQAAAPAARAGQPAQAAAAGAANVAAPAGGGGLLGWLKRLLLG